METKICITCGIEKLLSEFHKHKGRKDGLTSECKLCVNKRGKIYVASHKEETALNQHNYYLANKDELCLYQKLYAKEHKPEIFISRQNYRFEHKDEIAAKKHKDYLEHRPERIAQNVKNRQIRYDTDPIFKLLCCIRSRVRDAFKRFIVGKKCACTLDLLMCDMGFYKLWIELQWQPGMTWSNYGHGEGKWNIDHIIPCSFFNLVDPVEQYMCFRYQNTQPMWHVDNVKKANRIY